MADLITHTCTAVLCQAALDRRGTALRDGRLAVFIAGTCLPDFLGRVPPMALTEARWTFPSIPEWAVYLWGPLHMPTGILVTSYLFSFLFPEQGRPSVFRYLLGGGMLHIAVDILQSHFGVGYLLLFPFSLWDYEAGLIGSETTVLIVPFLLPITLLVARWRWSAHKAQ